MVAAAQALELEKELDGIAVKFYLTKMKISSYPTELLSLLENFKKLPYFIGCLGGKSYIRQTINSESELKIIMPILIKAKVMLITPLPISGTFCHPYLLTV